MSPALGYLPEEILLAILLFVRRNDLKAVRLTCQRLSRLTEHLLFQSLVFPLLSKSRAWRKGWLDESECEMPRRHLRHVQQISLGVHKSPGGSLVNDAWTEQDDEMTKAVEFLRSPIAHEMLRRLFREIDRHKLSQLNVLAQRELFQFIIPDDEYVREEAVQRFPALRRLIGFGGVFDTSLQEQMPDFAILLPSIGSQLEAITWRGTSRILPNAFLSLLMNNSLTVKYVHLELHDMSGSAQNYGWPFRTTFPSLQSLRLSRTFFQETPSSVSAATNRISVSGLRRLDIWNCEMCFIHQKAFAEAYAKLEHLEFTATTCQHRGQATTLFDVIGQTAVLQNCFVSIWSPSPDQNRELWALWPEFTPWQSRHLKRVVLESVSLRCLSSELSGQPVRRQPRIQPRVRVRYGGRELSGETFGVNVLSNPAVMKSVISVDPECLAISINVREMHLLAVSLHQLASHTSNIKIIHLRWPGIVKKHAPNAWNSSSVFDWPADTSWFRRVNDRSPESDIMVRVFDVCLAYTTSKIPHDLQKVVHWAFGPEGFPSLKIVAFGDFGTGARWRDSTAVYRKNDQAEPWPASYKESTRSLSIHPNFRHVGSDDWWYQDLVDRNMDFLAACPCELDTDKLHRQRSLGDFQVHGNRHFQVIDDTSQAGVAA